MCLWIKKKSWAHLFFSRRIIQMFLTRNVLVFSWSGRERVPNGMQVFLTSNVLAFPWGGRNRVPNGMQEYWYNLNTESLPVIFYQSIPDNLERTIKDRSMSSLNRSLSFFFLCECLEWRQRRSSWIELVEGIRDLKRKLRTPVPMNVTEYID